MDKETTVDWAEELGLLADHCDNLLGAAKLPVPAVIHVEGLKGGVAELGGKLRKLVDQAALASRPVEPTESKP